jgi:hypothetical protein
MAAASPVDPSSVSKPVVNWEMLMNKSMDRYVWFSRMRLWMGACKHGLGDDDARDPVTCRHPGTQVSQRHNQHACWAKCLRCGNRITYWPATGKEARLHLLSFLSRFPSMQTPPRLGDSKDDMGLLSQGVPSTRSTEEEEEERQRTESDSEWQEVVFPE